MSELRETIVIDAFGRHVSTFEGNPDAWMNQFKSDAQLMIRIDKSRGNGQFSPIVDQHVALSTAPERHSVVHGFRKRVARIARRFK